MAKKRPLWWIGGGIVMIGIAIATITLTGGNDDKTVADIELAVENVVEVYGFELRGDDFELRSDHGVVDFYYRSPLAADEADEIVSLLRAASPSWDDEQSSDEGFHSFLRSTGYGGQVIWITFMADDKGDEPDYDEPIAFLIFANLDEITILQRISTILPFFSLIVPMSGIAIYWSLSLLGWATRRFDDDLDNHMQAMRKKPWRVKIMLILSFGGGISIIVLALYVWCPGFFY